jgi:hypothetical protein
VLQELLSKALRVVARIGADPDDSDDVRLHKVLMVGAVMGGFFVILLWG